MYKKTFTIICDHCGKEITETTIERNSDAYDLVRKSGWEQLYNANRELVVACPDCYEQYKVAKKNFEKEFWNGNNGATN